MRFGIIGVIVAIFFVMTGIARLSDSFSYRAMQTMSMADFARHPLTQGWVRITDARVNLMDGVAQGMVYGKKKVEDKDLGPDDITTVLAPLAPAADKVAAAPYKLYLASTNPDWVALMGKATSDTAATPLTDSDLKTLADQKTMTVEGMLQPISLGADDLKKFGIAAGTPVLAEAEHPRAWPIGFTILCGGLAILISVANRIRKVLTA